MAKAKTEYELLTHMEKQFEMGGGKLSARLPGWTAVKARALSLALTDALNYCTNEDLAAHGVLDLGVGDMQVIEAIPRIYCGAVRYVGIEGSPKIYAAAVDRMHTWPIPGDLLNIPFSEFVATDLTDEVGTPAVVTALDVLYHIPDDDLYEEFLGRVFDVALSHVVLSHATDEGQRFNSASGAGGNGYGWFPRRFEVPEGWEAFHEQDAKSGPQKQRVVVLRRVA